MDICDTNNDESYIDPSVMVIGGAYYVAIKNEITSHIELWCGKKLNTADSSKKLRKITTFQGEMIEAPSIVYEPTTRIITVYGSAYAFGGAIRDILLASSYRIFGDASTFTPPSVSYWRLCNYNSIYRARHPYIIPLSNSFKNILEQNEVVSAPLYPEKITGLWHTMNANGKIYFTTTSNELRGFICHPTIAFEIRSNVENFVSDPQEYELNILSGVPCRILLKAETGCKIGFVFGDSWGTYAGKRFQYTSEDGIPVYATFYPDATGVNYIADAQTAKYITD
jgi:hypothetical protein